MTSFEERMAAKEQAESEAKAEAEATAEAARVNNETAVRAKGREMASVMAAGIEQTRLLALEGALPAIVTANGPFGHRIPCRLLTVQGFYAVFPEVTTTYTDHHYGIVLPSGELLVGSRVIPQGPEPARAATQAEIDSAIGCEDRDYMREAKATYSECVTMLTEVTSVTWITKDQYERELLQRREPHTGQPVLSRTYGPWEPMANREYANGAGAGLAQNYQTGEAPATTPE
jgi:hypothetical protein